MSGAIPPLPQYDFMAWYPFKMQSVVHKMKEALTQYLKISSVLDRLPSV
jgi:hypothetical protein